MAAVTDGREIRRLWSVLAFLLLGALLLVNLASFGIWDPWELEAADAARRLADGETSRADHAGVWASALGFSLFGVDEWSGRAPVALGGLLAALLGYALVARFAGRRAGLYALVIVGTSPLFVFNARAMLGEAPSFAIQAGIALSACMACFAGEARQGVRYGWLALTLVLVVLGVQARGALLGALPPLAAVAAVAAADGRLSSGRTDPAGALATYTLWGLTLMFTAAITLGAIADASAYSPWLGGSPRGGQPPRFDLTLGRVFHAFAPWSALLPLALARMPLSPEGGASGDERRLRMVLLLWAAVGYAAHTLFLSRYGDAAAFLPIVALAGAVALFLRDVERSATGQWPAAIAIAMLGGLLIRDYSLYPAAPIHGMAIDQIEVPKVFNPKRIWGGLLGFFLCVTALSLGAGAQRNLRESRFGAPYRFLRELWGRSFGHMLWLVCLVLLLLVIEVGGALALTGQVRVTTQGLKWVKRLMLIAPALPLAVFAVQLLLKLFSGERGRSLPILLAGALVGGYAAHGFMPALSAHFSPREVYETYNALAGDEEPLGEFKVGGRAAAYYAKGPVEEISTAMGLVNFMVADERRWAVFPESELPSVNRMYRRKTKRHLFIADARSARVLLGTNQPIADRENDNFLVTQVLEDVPDIQHRVDANLDEKILFLGYDLKLPHGDHVAAGEKFEVTWYFRALKHVPGNWRIFVHIDGGGKRIHGDHYPLDGRYPVSMWEKGDVIVDRQTLEVPPQYPATGYTIYLGFYSGETRMPVVAGPQDDVNRINAGVLRIR